MTQRTFSRRSFLKLLGATAASTSVATLGSFLYASEIEPHWVDVHQVPLPLPRLQSQFDGYRLVHITDLHMDAAWMTRERLTGLVRLVNAQQPDLVAITGDFITDSPDVYGEDLRAALSLLEARDGVVGVLGNHDHWSSATISRQVLRASNVRELADATLTLRRSNALLHVVGLDDLWPDPYMQVDLLARQPGLAQLASGLPADGAAILLVHEPDFADISAEVGRFDLQLSGHSHGGQVRAPIYGNLVAPFLATKYPDRRYQVGSMIQYTGRGLGMVWPQVRFNCRPEITVFTLTGLA
jgi:predicted MPP superfamily phosphohydrolase